MRIAVVGTGDMGGALAVALSRKHEVSVAGSRLGSASAAAAVAASGGKIREIAVEQAREAELIVFAVPWETVDDVVQRLGDMSGKVVMVVTVPWIEGQNLAVGTTTSGAEIIASKLHGARVAQAFNTISSATVRAIDAYEQKPTALVCGDDESAKNAVRALARDIGFDEVDGGPLLSARFTEPIGMMWAQLAFEGGYGEKVAFRVVKRE
ncbi:MAG TPA: NAD(P)-binding domain-containing protein [Vicinamibacterales bacterium]